MQSHSVVSYTKYLANDVMKMISQVTFIYTNINMLQLDSPRPSAITIMAMFKITIFCK